MVDTLPTDVADRAAPPPRLGGTADLTPWGFPRLKTCPKCEYSLAGLPAPPYRCPECALEYDEYSCEWEARHWRTAWRLIVFVFAITWRLLLLCSMLLVRNPAFPVWLRLFLIVVLGSQVVAAALWLLSPGRRYVAITPQGIHARGSTFRTVFIPWKSNLYYSYDDVGWGVLRWKPKLIYRKGRLPRTIGLRDVLPTASAKSQFAQALEEGRRRYAGGAEGQHAD